MECNKKVLVVCGRWNGIYRWGKGFLSHDKAENWKKFWEDFNSLKKENDLVGYWSYGVDDNGTPYLFSTYGCVYMHPMDFTAFLTFEINLESYYGYRGIIDELNKICQLISEYCGGEFHMTTEECSLSHNLCINSMNDKDKGFNVIS